MWWATLDGLVLGALVTLALLKPWRRDDVGSTVAIATVGVVGGLVGGLLGFSLIAGSTASGPLQVAAIVGGAVGAVISLIVFRSWVLGDRAAAVAAVAAAEARAAAAEREQQRAAGRARRTANGPSKLAELGVLVLARLRR